MNTETESNVPWMKWQQAMMDESTAYLQRMGNIPSIVKKAQNVKKGATPSEVVYEEDRLKLLHYISDEPPKHKTPLIFVFALVNRPYILDLKDNRSVVSHFVKAGFDTYLIDWGSPTHADRFLGMEDYVNGYIKNVVDYVTERNGTKKASILGYCMGGTLSSMFTSLHQEKVKNLILLAAGIDFSTREGLLNLWADPENFNVDEFIDAHGNCPAEFLQSCFTMLKPVQNLIEKPLNFFENMHNDKFVEDFLAMETWLNDNIAVPGEVYRQFVKYLYQKNLLVQNKLPVGKHTVNLKNITCPVLNILAQSDDLVPCSQSLPFTDLVGSKDRKTVVVPAGHIGLAVGGKAQREVWPDACNWLGDRS